VIAARTFVVGFGIGTVLAAAFIARSARAQYLSPSGFNADLITPAGIHVQTNGQYKSEATKKSAAAAIDRYWDEVHRCADGVISPDERTFREKLIPEFPRHLSIEIADDWKIVEGPESHRKQQAFASDLRPGALVTARREEEALYIKVVPELNGLGRQMAGELNLWLAGNTSAMTTDLSNECSNLACYRFDYDNSPSEAWQDCTE
jgi:hypothetical protein